MLFPLGDSTKDGIVRILSVSWPLSAIKIWNALSRENYNVSYKGVFKSLKELTEEKIIEKTSGEYKLNEQWLKTTANTALEILRSYHFKNKVTKHEMVVNFTVYKYSDEFYRLLVMMLNNSAEIRLASKTPALLIRDEAAKSYLRDKYVEILWKKVREGEKLYYLFPTEVAMELVKGSKRTKILLQLEEIERYPNLQIRHAPYHSVVKMAIIKNEAIIGLASPPHTDLAAFLKIEGSDLSGLVELYNSIFANAQTINSLL